jgi:hypothetical protein
VALPTAALASSRNTARQEAAGVAVAALPTTSKETRIKYRNKKFREFSPAKWGNTRKKPKHRFYLLHWSCLGLLLPK